MSAVPFEAPWLCVAVPASVAVISCATLFWLGYRGWPGEMGVTALMFCERLRDGVVQQPSNSFSNIGFILVGLTIG